jgi:hypothetical protein
MLEFQPNAIRNLVAQMQNSADPKDMIDTDGGGNFVIPTGKGFLLKDVIFVPQLFPLKGLYILQIGSSQGISLVYGESSSLQTSFTTGLVLKSGSPIRASYNNSIEANIGSATVHVFGYLFDVG